jgi:hypothetical protein
LAEHREPFEKRRLPAVIVDNPIIVQLTPPVLEASVVAHQLFDVVIVVRLTLTQRGPRCGVLTAKKWLVLVRGDRGFPLRTVKYMVKVAFLAWEEVGLLRGTYPPHFNQSIS